MSLNLEERIASNQLTHEEPAIFEKSREGRNSYSLPPSDVPEADAKKLIPQSLYRSSVEGFPEVSENEIVRHFVRLSQKNYSIDTGFYPLGSCTMKYNPKINEEMARESKLAAMHPLIAARTRPCWYSDPTARGLRP